MRPAGLDLSNWRERPYSPWSFQHVMEIIPSAIISSNGVSSIKPESPATGLDNIRGIPVADGYGDLETFLLETGTDALLVTKGGNVVADWYAAHFDPGLPHILFSISKSVTATVAGIMQHKGLLDPTAPVSEYLDVAPESAYADCTVQHVLDMEVALDIEENYTAEATDYMAYRRASGWAPVDQTEGLVGLREFICNIPKLDGYHGEVFRYRSPNSDLLGMILASAGNKSFPALMCELLWQPMGAQSDAYITVDHFGEARTAGGICVTLSDLQQLGQLICDQGKDRSGKRILPTPWIEEVFHGGNAEAWKQGDFGYMFENGKYRNKWYQSGNSDNAIYALGIHGQYLYINPTTNIVISRFASQHLAVDDPVEDAVMSMCDNIAAELS